MTATDADTAREVRYAVDKVFRRRVIHQTYFHPPERYAALLDEMTTEIMGCLPQPEKGK